ncbi:MAG TPA: [NiFe]-hydrogenase assembly chaperone HybE [Steroidobacteraceae bacterium]|nr:[NiFe]-hydrogenase assembly chaperone HybE [Steroidobacteraceae bacterium]
MSQEGDGAGPGREAVRSLVDYYRRAAERMRALPVYNAALAVEAIGFRAHDGRQVGVIVTPWFMNLVALPTTEDQAGWQKGRSTRLAFPSGRYDFVVSEAGENGLIATCSLFPLMHDFADQASARDAAAAAVTALMQPEPPAEPPAPKAAPQLSRRKFLGG